MSTDTNHSAGKIENLKRIRLFPFRFKFAENFLFHLSSHAHLTPLANYFVGASPEIIVFFRPKRDRFFLSNGKLNTQDNQYCRSNCDNRGKIWSWYRPKARENQKSLFKTPQHQNRPQTLSGEN